MAERRFSVTRLLRRKKKKEDPGLAPAQQPEEVEQFQPLQEGRDQTQDQDRARGRFRRAAQAFLKFVGVRRGQYRITPAEVTAQPDPTPSELKAHPEVGTALTDGTANCDSAVTDDGTKSNTALPELTMEADGAMTEGIADTESIPVQCLPDALSLEVLDEGVVSVEVAMEPDRGMERRPRRVPKLTWVKKEEESSGVPPAQHPEEVEQFQPLQEGRDRTQDQDRARGRFRRAAQRVRKSKPVRRRKARTSPTKVIAQPEPNLTKLKAKADTPQTEGIADTDTTPIQCLPDAPSVEVLDEGVISAQVALKPNRGMEQRPPSMPKVTLVKEEEEEEGPVATPAEQPEEVEQFQPLQEDPGRDQNPEQDRARGRFHRADQREQKSKPIRRRKARTSPSQTMAQPEPIPTELKAKAGSPTTEGIADSDRTPIQSLPDAPFLDEGVVFTQVPAVVRSIHWWLTANVSAGHVLDNTLLALTQAHPADVAISLLRCAPSCDRAAAVMWRTIASSGTTLEKVLPTLLSVMEDWPWHSTRTSDGDNTDVFALAATRVIWEILQVLQCPEPLKKYSPRLLVDLLFQISISPEQTPEEVDTLWRECQKEYDLPTNSKRFAVLTMKALLCHLECEDVMVSMERKRAWDTLLRADTHHYAVGLLAREMRRASSPLYYPIARCLLRLLSREKTCWELPAMAFLVEVLDCPNMTEWSDSVLEILSRRLWSQCTEMRRLVLRGLVVLSKAPGMADGMRSLTRSLVEVLWDTDGELVWAALSVFIDQVQDRDIRISTPTALRLAEVLQPLFGHDNIHVQVLSIDLFRKVMELGVEESKQPLKTHIIFSLLPLFFHWHDENQDVAEASRKALLCAAWLLKRRDLVKLLKAEQPWRFSECLLEKDKRRAAEYLHQALPYLESPQESVREAALRFIGMAGRYLKGQREELQIAIDVIEGMTPDSAAVKSLALQTQEILRAVQRPQSYPGFSGLKISSRMHRIGRLLRGAAAGGQRRTDPGNPV
ncbi:uncharacterized protein LOC127472609 isoform X25 [Manacus candei]|uniref:uncharacterized protein LOC127472609 isoform X17 n=1 Tax=Manacus candei TaxID=415023 RepID=UPI0022278DE2|nr:uncharacterized protein LOC127472609 isoform X17 [Manacus candei]XP_051647057.1 uncharacterized protein LOC127472609 isoform X18 [Manacus candei]XP_051647060.1 uncharacterized protein LOC127472609 isoform X21 [Manacus candei]XP_051647065.1 uncharacterized protein LOC127472609 isoform X25 [Manacus candei]